MPPLPKVPSTRRGHRSNSPRRVLQAVENPDIPDLPDYVEWHDAVKDFWNSVWSSPMPQEWDESDRHNVLMASMALQTVWTGESSPTARSAAMAECRLILRECGLTPMSRRTLQIEIERADEAVERGTTRRGGKPPTKAQVAKAKKAADAKDPRRAHLASVG